MPQATVNEAAEAAEATETAPKPKKMSIKLRRKAHLQAIGKLRRKTPAQVVPAAETLATGQGTSEGEPVASGSTEAATQSSAPVAPPRAKCGRKPKSKNPEPVDPSPPVSGRGMRTRRSAKSKDL